MHILFLLFFSFSFLFIVVDIVLHVAIHNRNYIICMHAHGISRFFFVRHPYIYINKAEYFSDRQTFSPSSFEKISLDNGISLRIRFNSFFSLLPPFIRTLEKIKTLWRADRRTTCNCKNKPTKNTVE